MPTNPISLKELINQNINLLTKSERKVAEVFVNQPRVVAFGTVNDVANAAATGVATVARLASKLGMNGFSQMQASLRLDFARNLEPAALRIKQTPVGNLDQMMQMEMNNIQDTFQALDQTRFDQVVGQLSKLDAQVFVLSGNASRGVAIQFVEDLNALRDGVYMIEGNPVQVARQMTQIKDADVVLALDLKRYDRWVLNALSMLRHPEHQLIAVVDSVLSPLSQYTSTVVQISAAGSGPFDSHVGTLALFNAIVGGVAGRLRGTATDRLDLAERVWHEHALMIEKL